MTKQQQLLPQISCKKPQTYRRHVWLCAGRQTLRHEPPPHFINKVYTLYRCNTKRVWFIRCDFYPFCQMHCFFCFNYGNKTLQCFLHTATTLFFQFSWKWCLLYMYMCPIAMQLPIWIWAFWIINSIFPSDLQVDHIQWIISRPRGKKTPSFMAI